MAQQTITGQFMLTKNVAQMLADCIASGLAGCNENMDNSDAEIYALEGIEIRLRNAIRTLTGDRTCAGIAQVMLGEECCALIEADLEERHANHGILKTVLPEDADWLASTRDRD